MAPSIRDAIRKWDAVTNEVAEQASNGVQWRSDPADPMPDCTCRNPDAQWPASPFEYRHDPDCPWRRWYVRTRERLSGRAG